MKTILKYLFFGLFAIALSHHGSAQRVKDILKKAGKDLNQSYPDYSAIETQLLEGKTIDPQELDIDYLLALVLLEQDHYQRALPYVDNIINSGEEYARDFDFYKGLILQRDHKFELAINIFDQYKSKFTTSELGLVEVLSVTNYLIEEVRQGTVLQLVPFSNLGMVIDNHIGQCKNAMIIMKDVKDIEIVNLGYDINSNYDEYCPVYSQIDSTLYFTSRRPLPGHLKKDGFDELYIEHIFESDKKAGFWSKSKYEKAPLNSFTHNVSALAISDEGNDIFIFDHRNNGDIMHSLKKGKDSWTEPKIFDEVFNTNKVERSFAISDDKQLIIIERDGSNENNRDLFVSKFENERWTEPANIGDVINTEYDEDAVFLHNNGKELYFSSKGHNSIGGYDIFKSVWQDTAWSKPMNMGVPINSVYDDIYFSISDDERKGFLSSNRPGGNGGYDVYTIDFFPLPKTQTIFVKLVDADNGSGVRDADVYLIDKVSGTKYPMELMKDGTHQVVLENKENHAQYDLFAKKKNYVIGKTSFSVKDNVTSYDAGRVSMQEIKKEVVELVFNDVYLFDVNSAKFFVKYHDRLSVLINELDNYDVKILIEGHTDDVGSDKSNQKLSEKRAEEVKAYLVSKGVKEEQIVTVGFGESKPVNSNENKEERQLNRRAVVSLIE